MIYWMVGKQSDMLGEEIRRRSVLKRSAGGAGVAIVGSLAGCSSSDGRSPLPDCTDGPTPGTRCESSETENVEGANNFPDVDCCWYFRAGETPEENALTISIAQSDDRVPARETWVRGDLGHRSGTIDMRWLALSGTQTEFDLSEGDSVRLRHGDTLDHQTIKPDFKVKVIWSAPEVHNSATVSCFMGPDATTETR